MSDTENVFRKKSCMITQRAECILVFRRLEWREKWCRVGYWVVQRNRPSCRFGRSASLRLLQDEPQNLGWKALLIWQCSVSLILFIASDLGMKINIFPLFTVWTHCEGKIPLYFLSIQTCGYLDQTTYNWGTHKTDLLVNLPRLIHM